VKGAGRQRLKPDLGGRVVCQQPPLVDLCIREVRPREIDNDGGPDESAAADQKSETAEGRK